MLRCVSTCLALLFALPVAAEIELDGPLTQGGLMTGRIAPGYALELDGEPVKVAPDGRFVIGFGRDAELSHTLTVLDTNGGTVEQRSLRLEDRSFDIERIDGLPDETVTLPPEYYERRKRETGMVRKARAPVTDSMHWAEGFRWPARGRISGVYGSQRILNGEPRWPHYGVDVAAPEGTPVLAPASGVVQLAENDFLLEGGIVIIDHGFGVSSTLMHLASVDVEAGRRIAAGERIGTIGATGRATGAHVDWRINWRDRRLDPQLLVDEPSHDEARR
mgnify:CR=1 FL=1